MIKLRRVNNLESDNGEWCDSLSRQFLLSFTSVNFNQKEHLSLLIINEKLLLLNTQWSVPVNINSSEKIREAHMKSV